MNVSKMTLQEVFNYVSTHLLMQGEKSAEGPLGCMYRGPGGLKCAVGCLIDDVDYHPEMEDEFVAADPVKQALHLTNEHKSHLRLLAALQTVHDTEDPVHWVKELGIIARKFNLNFKYQL